MTEKELIERLLWAVDWDARHDFHIPGDSATGITLRYYEEVLAQLSPHTTPANPLPERDPRTS